MGDGELNEGCACGQKAPETGLTRTLVCVCVCCRGLLKYSGNDLPGVLLTGTVAGNDLRQIGGRGGVTSELNVESAVRARLHFPYGCSPTNLTRRSDHLVQMEAVRYISAVYCVT